MKTTLAGTIAPIAVVCFVSIVAIGPGCDKRSTQERTHEAAQPMKSIDEVIKTYSDSLMAIPGVVGVYHGLNDEGKSCLKVMVRKKTSEIEQRLPKKLEGYDVVIDETGEIKPMK